MQCICLFRTQTSSSAKGQVVKRNGDLVVCRLEIYDTVVVHFVLPMVVVAAVVGVDDEVNINEVEEEGDGVLEVGGGGPGAFRTP